MKLSLFDLNLNQVDESSLDKRVSYEVLRITDIKLHGNQKRPTQKQGKKIVKALEESKPVRTYHQHVDVQKIDENTITSKLDILGFLHNDPHFEAYVKKAQAMGKEVLLAFPSDGIPIYLGNDAAEFIAGTPAERKLRFAQKKINGV
jgi:hypothetical protein